jgi:hypothetical protein
MEAAIKAVGVKALRLLFVFAASVTERVGETVLTTESAALPVVKSIGPLALLSLCECMRKAFLGRVVCAAVSIKMMGNLVHQHIIQKKRSQRIQIEST